MSFLQTYLLRMAVFLVLVAIAAAFIAPGLQDAFLANVWLNGLILLILLVGIVYSFVQVLRLDRKSTRRTPVTNAHLVCRLLLEKKKKTKKEQRRVNVSTT